jgi:hypothetical protein
MKAITILQPWASLIACGAKKIETRSWATKYRGQIAIHVGKAVPDMNLFTPLIDRVLREEHIYLGKVIAIAELVACECMTPELIAMVTEPEKSFGWYEPGRYMWMLANVRGIEPVPAKGMQRIWEWAHETFASPR